jgi:hypothetical protein
MAFILTMSTSFCQHGMAEHQQTGFSSPSGRFFLKTRGFQGKPEVFIKQVGKPEVLVYILQIRRIEVP